MKCRMLTRQQTASTSSPGTPHILTHLVTYPCFMFLHSPCKQERWSDSSTASRCSSITCALPVLPESKLLKPSRGDNMVHTHCCVHLLLRQHAIDCGQNASSFTALLHTEQHKNRRPRHTMTKGSRAMATLPGSTSQKGDQTRPNRNKSPTHADHSHINSSISQSRN